jgi:putative ABC transport system ATP-binding protein
MIRLEKVSKIYRTRRGDVRALDKVSLDIKEGEFLAVRGPSGSGKTTLLFSIGGMLCPTEGNVIVSNRNLYAISKSQRAKFRAVNIGFIFQMFQLVPYLNTVENVLLAARVGTKCFGPEDAKSLLNRLKLSDRMYHRPSELSAGERQRTAMARAMLKRPGIILADEPTGNLDPENVEKILRHLVEYNQNGGTVILVSHRKEVDNYASHVIHLKDGHIQEYE